MIRRLLLSITLTGAGAAAYALAFTPWQRRWGATDDEVERAMPGDDVVSDVDYQTTRAISVNAAPQYVWPWLAQMGYHRGGLYSYDTLDILFGILDRPSSPVVLPDFQDLRNGDVIPIGKGGNFYVHQATPNAILVIGPEDRSIPVSWATVLYPAAGGTRLVTRVRVRMSDIPGGPLAAAWLDLTAFIMVRRWLQTLKQHAERLAAGQLVRQA
jgi:hypothetical protein